MLRREWTRRWRTLGGTLCVALLGPVLLGIAVSVGHAQTDRTQYFVDLLQTSTSFRVRAQAALALGRVPTSDAVRSALTRALRDDEPAVRAAAASAMERLADVQLLRALQAAVRSERDATVRAAERQAVASLERVASAGSSGSSSTSSGSSRPQPTGTPRYYVGIGMPGDNSATLNSAALRELREYLAGRVGGVEGVVLAPDNESASATTRALRRNRLIGYFVDASVVSIEEGADGTTVRVSVILATYPGRDMRAMLSGSARVPGTHGERAITRGIQGAIQGALRRLPQAMQASEARASR